MYSFHGCSMKQRGRKSASDLATLCVDGEPPRLNPPADLTDDERILFVELVDVCSRRHFVPSDMPLLVSYVQATLLSRRAITNAAKDASALASWEKAVRMQATLATRLRLSPQSRADPKTVTRQQPKLVRPPWEA
jgi:hypothetical protein